MAYVLKNIENVKISSNEIFNRFTLNRNFEKLLQNDKDLERLKFDIVSGRIRPFVEGAGYEKNDLIWYICKSPLSGKRELFLLRSTISDNIHTPEMKIIDGQITFEDSGWLDVLDLYTILNNNFNGHIDSYIVNRLNTEHQFDSRYHRYGTLRESNLSSEILLTDISNIDKNRKTLHFPYMTGFMEENETILNGQYRIWDCGILEYNVLFRLGYRGDKFDLNGNQIDVVTCNDLQLSNYAYYGGEDGQNIFNRTDISSESDYVFINDRIEVNHDDFVNSYSSTIRFPVPFMDTNYMAFSSVGRIEEHDMDAATIDEGRNSLTFANKYAESIVPVYIAFQNAEMKNAYRAGLVQNSFQCQFVGRWR